MDKKHEEGPNCKKVDGEAKNVSECQLLVDGNGKESEKLQLHFDQSPSIYFKF